MVNIYELGKVITENPNVLAGIRTLKKTSNEKPIPNPYDPGKEIKLVIKFELERTWGTQKDC